MKVNATISLCISKDVELDVEKDATLKDIHNAFMVQEGYPLGVSDYPQDNKWFVDNISIISS